MFNGIIKATKAVMITATGRPEFFPDCHGPEAHAAIVPASTGPHVASIIDMAAALGDYRLGLL